jgi:transcriptional regulator with XRE-family HTH domain
MATASWEEKEKRIKERHPDALDVSWSRAMQVDPDLFARIVGDVVKSTASGARPGKRPSLEPNDAFAAYSKLAGQDFSDKDFHSSFRALTHGHSIRAVSRKTSLAPSYIFKLLNDKATPSYETMAKIASAFKKDPSYFLEYRVGFVLSTIDTFLCDSPETASAWFLKMKGK